ncbi:MAG: efflux RND transporter periplasmic adaptor subunit [Nevskiales bacterium]|nr:efflux RND transporter periplasmic adaptor subunit [Nevskiales bacterium]
MKFSAPWTLTILLPLLLGACSGQSPPAPAGAPQDAVAVEVQLAETTTLPRTVDAVGSIEAGESVVIRPEVAGRIVDIAFEEGETVPRGQLLFRLDDAIQRAELAQARADLALADSTHRRATRLRSEKLASQADADTAAAALEVAAAAVQLAQARLDKTLIRAPFAGVAGLRAVSPGAYVEAGDDLVRIESVDPLRVVFRIAEAQASRIAIGQTVQLRVDGHEQPFVATVAAIDARVSAETRSLTLKARLANPDGALRPGQFARVRLQTGAPSPTVTVSEDAVFPRGDGQYAYVVEGGRAVEREVSLGQRIAGRVEIRSGIRAGEPVVTSGLQRISNGAPVVTSPARSDDG